MDDETIHEIVAGLVLHGVIPESECQTAGDVLRGENVYAVGAGNLAYRHRGTACTVGQVAKSLRCYWYQTADSASWEGSYARDWCCALAVALLDAVPGFLEAEWR